MLGQRPKAAQHPPYARSLGGRYGYDVASAAKRSEYAVTVERDGRVVSEGGEPLPVGEGWTPEHLVLAALARCTLTSLAYHAGRSSLELEAGADATGVVGQRDDASWGFLEITCRLEVELGSSPPEEELSDLIRRAERGCFVGASLAPKPDYRWVVNDRETG